MTTRPTPTRPGWHSLIACLLVALAAPVAIQTAAARQSQAPPERFGFGLQAGPLSGFSIKGYPPRSTDGRFESVTLTGSLNFKGFAFTQAVLLDEIPLRTSPLTVYLGPGLAGELRDGQASAGIAAAVGVRFFKARVEVYMELTPRLMILPDRDARVAAGVGFRIYP